MPKRLDVSTTIIAAISSIAAISPVDHSSLCSPCPGKSVSGFLDYGAQMPSSENRVASAMS
jgi:hypothetical protein